MILSSSSSLVSYLYGLKVGVGSFDHVKSSFVQLLILTEGMCMCVIRVWLFATLWTVACQAPLSMGFPRQEYWSGLPFPSPGDLPHPGTETISLASPALQADSLPSEPPGKPGWRNICFKCGQLFGGWMLHVLVRYCGPHSASHTSVSLFSVYLSFVL